MYNPDIGDGRGFLFAQLRDAHGRLLDLGTKGSGQTPYSRFGDGRLTLKGGIREILATEMLEALGAETSKTFSLIETGEALERNDEPSPTRSAVLVRLQHSHIRIGTFQRLATLDQPDNIRKLTDYCLRFYYGDDSGDPARLLGHVAGAGRPPRRILYRRRLRPRRAQFGQYRDHRAELRLRALALDALIGTAISPPPISTIRASIPSPASPRRSTGTSSSSPSPCARSPTPSRSPPCSKISRTFSRRRCATRSSPGSASCAGDLAKDMALVGAIEEALSKQNGDDRPLLLRLARRPHAERL